MWVKISDTNLRELITATHPLLVKVFNTMLMFWEGDMVVTSFNRSHAHDKALGGSGIHAAGPPWRAIDVDGPEMTQEKIEAVCEKVNDLWQYDPARPTLKCAVGHPHGTGKHLHLQVSPSTIRRIT